MRFLFLSSAYYPATKMGGPLHSVRSLAEALVARGHEVTVAVSNWDLLDKLDVDTTIDYHVCGVRVRYFDMCRPLLTRIQLPGFKHSVARVAGRDWKRWIRANIDSFDVVDIQISFLSFAPLAARLTRKHSKVLFYHQRGVLDPIRLRINKWRKTFYMTCVERQVLKKSNVFIALTQHEAESYRLQNIKRPIKIIPNGIDINYGEGEITMEAWVEELIKTVEKNTVFMWMSRIHETKGADIFVEAFILAARKVSNIVGVLAGPDETGLEPQLKARIAAEGLQGRFHFTGSLTGHNKIAMLRRSDVFVFPTIAEGFSMVLLEALACGCAILTSRGAYFDEIAESGAGRIVRRTVNDFADAMLQILEQGKIRDFGEQGKKLVKQRYTWDMIADTYQELALDSKILSQ